MQCLALSNMLESMAFSLPVGVFIEAIIGPHVRTNAKRSLIHFSQFSPMGTVSTTSFKIFLMV